MPLKNHKIHTIKKFLSKFINLTYKKWKNVPIVKIMFGLMKLKFKKLIVKIWHARNLDDISVQNVYKIMIHKNNHAQNYKLIIVKNNIRNLLMTKKNLTT
jgi:hypothetical protein